MHDVVVHGVLLALCLDLGRGPLPLHAVSYLLQFWCNIPQQITKAASPFFSTHSRTLCKILLEGLYSLPLWNWTTNDQPNHGFGDRIPNWRCAWAPLVLERFTPRSCRKNPKPKALHPKLKSLEPRNPETQSPKP